MVNGRGAFAILRRLSFYVRFVQLAVGNLLSRYLVALLNL